MVLEIFVGPCCTPSVEARAVAGDIQAQFPWLQVELVEVDGRRELPERVVATPTYLLDGKVIALGNPRRDWLARVISDNHSSEGGAP
jgi:hypothetical protein